MKLMLDLHFFFIRLVDEGANSNLSYAPYVSLSDHTLPISDVHVSHGIFPDIRIFTASLDQTVKVNLIICLGSSSRF